MYIHTYIHISKHIQTYTYIQSALEQMQYALDRTQNTLGERESRMHLLQASLDNSHPAMSIARKAIEERDMKLNAFQVYTYICACMYAYMNICVCIYLYMYVCMYMFVYVYMHIYTCDMKLNALQVCIYLCACIYAYIHMCVCV